MIKLIITVILALASFSATAADIVFDPTNFTRNAITAAQTAKQTVVQTNQLMTQVRQYQVMLQNLKNLPPQAISSRVLGSIPGDVGEAARTANDLYQTYSQMSYTLQQIELSNKNLAQSFEQANRVSFLSGQSVSDMLTTEIQMHQNGKRAATDFGNYFSTQAADILNYQRRADELAKRIPENEGVMQGLGTLAGQQTVVIDALSNLTATANLQAKSQQQDKYEQETKNEHDAKYRESWETSKDKARKDWGVK